MNRLMQFSKETMMHAWVYTSVCDSKLSVQCKVLQNVGFNK